MKVFVTGSTGFIGCAVAIELARRGHHVFGLTRSKEKARALERAEVELVLGNLDDPSSYSKVADACDALVHCAAEYTARYMQLDALTVETLAKSAARANAPRTFVYTSGAWVYGDTHGRAVDEQAELHPPPMVAPRAHTERDVLAANGKHVRTMVLRPGCVYGQSGSLTSLWFDSAAKEGAARIVGDGKNRWAMVHVADLADAYARAVEAPSGGAIFNVVDGSRSSVRECAEAASRAAGAKGKTAVQSVAEAAKTLGPMAVCLAMDQQLDASKCTRVLGWQPRHPGFVAGVERYHRAFVASR